MTTAERTTLTAVTLYTLERVDGHVYVITRSLTDANGAVAIAGPMDDVVDRDNNIVDPEWIRDADPDDPDDPESLADALAWYRAVLHADTPILDIYIGYSDGSVQRSPISTA